MQKRHPRAAPGSEAAPVPVDGTDSFAAFFEDHHADLFGAVYLITRNRHEAEEITQDAFLKVLERWERVSSLADPVGYLYRTAMNLFRKRWRRASVMLRRTVGLSDRDDLISVIETRVDVARALASLSPRQRAVVVLTELLEFSSEEAGRMLGDRAGHGADACVQGSCGPCRPAGRPSMRSYKDALENALRGRLREASAGKEIRRREVLPGINEYLAA